MAKLKSEEEVKELFADIKWGDKFCCARCGCSEYTKGDKFPDRRCGNCKKNESLYVNTALEGLRFGADKMYRVLDIIFKSMHICYDRPIIFYDWVYMSIDDFNRDYSHHFIGEDGREEKWYRIYYAKLAQQWKLAEIARKVRIEENSLALRLTKIAARMPPACQCDNYYDTIKHFTSLEYYRNGSDVGEYVFSFEDFLKVILFPAKGVWSKGLLKYKNYTLEFEDEPGLRIYFDCTEEAEEDAIDELGEISYASDSWKYIFVENSEAK